MLKVGRLAKGGEVKQTDNRPSVELLSYKGTLFLNLWPTKKRDKKYLEFIGKMFAKNGFRIELCFRRPDDDKTQVGLSIRLKEDK